MLGLHHRCGLCICMCMASVSVVGLGGASNTGLPLSLPVCCYRSLALGESLTSLMTEHAHSRNVDLYM